MDVETQQQPAPAEAPAAPSPPPLPQWMIEADTLDLQGEHRQLHQLLR